LVSRAGQASLSPFIAEVEGTVRFSDYGSGNESSFCFVLALSSDA